MPYFIPIITCAPFREVRMRWTLRCHAAYLTSGRIYYQKPDRITTIRICRAEKVLFDIQASSHTLHEAAAFSSIKTIVNQDQFRTVDYTLSKVSTMPTENSKPSYTLPNSICLKWWSYIQVCLQAQFMPHAILCHRQDFHLKLVKGRTAPPQTSDNTAPEDLPLYPNRVRPCITGTSMVSLPL